MFVTPAGILVTNYHVIKGAANILARLPSGAFYVVKAFLPADEKADIAILKFDATESPSVKGLGDSDRLRVGDAVYAIGAPVGLGAPFPLGISAILPDRSTENGSFSSRLQFRPEAAGVVCSTQMARLLV